METTLTEFIKFRMEFENMMERSNFDLDQATKHDSYKKHISDVIAIEMKMHPDKFAPPNLRDTPPNMESMTISVSCPLYHGMWYETVMVMWMDPDAHRRIGIQFQRATPTEIHLDGDEDCLKLAMEIVDRVVAEQ